MVNSDVSPGPGSGSADLIDDMRSVMERMRLQRLERQTALVHNADYDMETRGITAQFIGGILRALPIEPKAEGLSVNSFVNAVATKDADNLRVTSSYAVYVNHHSKGSKLFGLVLGERLRAPSSSRVNLTDVLLLGWQGVIGSLGRVTTAPVVHRATVQAEVWQQIRDNQQAQLTTPFPPERAQAMAHLDTGTFVLDEDASCIPSIGFYYGDLSKRFTARGFKKAASLTGPTPFLPASALNYGTGLVASDFINYDVLPKLDVLCAAFDVSDEFDRLTQERAEAMPASPATELGGPADLVQTLERSPLPRES